jgi:hypothetical protein
MPIRWQAASNSFSKEDYPMMSPKQVMGMEYTQGVKS